MLLSDKVYFLTTFIIPLLDGHFEYFFYFLTKKLYLIRV